MTMPSRPSSAPGDSLKGSVPRRSLVQPVIADVESDPALAQSYLRNSRPKAAKVAVAHLRPGGLDL